MHEALQAEAEAFEKSSEARRDRGVSPSRGANLRRGVSVICGLEGLVHIPDKLSCTGLIFVEPSVEVNCAYYRDVLTVEGDAVSQSFNCRRPVHLWQRARETVSLAA